MLSAFTQKGAEVTVKALELGAFDFVTKPQSKNESESLEILQRTLLPKLINYDTLKNKWLNKRNFPDSQILSPTNIDTVQIVKSKNHNSRKIKVIAIGISTGGPKALTEMLPDLCKLTELPILIVQHMPEHFTQSLAESLTKKCSHIVKEAENDELIMDGYVYIARGNKHMLIRRNEENQPCIMLNDQPPENGCRPSVDVLFRSISNVYRGDCITIIMTGMGSDGSSSLYSLKRAGAYILAQDEPTSIVWGMPGSAVATGCVDEVVSLEDLPDKIGELIIKAESGGIRWN
jgi:two-component system chemotaxis response regulator CheB